MRPPKLIMLAVALAGCDALADPDRDLTQKVTKIREHMHVRFAATNGIRTALTYGDLPRARAEARIVADLGEREILPQWSPYVDNVRAAASQITKSEDLVTTAKQLALLGWRCAQCHEAVPDAKIVFSKVLRQPPDRKLAATMAGHQWAVARMWEGLIGPSAERWNEGGTALAKAPLTITAESGELGIGDAVARIRLLATRAHEAKTTFDRADIYGQLLATCASCHRTIRDR
jgi:hypothetical protein